MTSFKMNEEYFSGSQASIFMGDVWIDDIVEWQCSIGANATPIYGYGQTFFSHAAQGRVLVQGSFTINFKEPNYIFAALAKYRVDPYLSATTQQQDFLKLDNIKEASFEDKRKSLDDFFYQNNKSLEFNNRSDRNNLSFGTYNGKVTGNVLKNSRLLGFDDEYSYNRAEELVNDFAVPTFDIKIGYGTELNSDTIGEKIIGIKLIGKGKVISANGEPLKETYRFFARNIV